MGGYYGEGAAWSVKIHNVHEIPRCLTSSGLRVRQQGQQVGWRGEQFLPWSLGAFCFQARREVLYFEDGCPSDETILGRRKQADKWEQVTGREARTQAKPLTTPG